MAKINKMLKKKPLIFLLIQFMFLHITSGQVTPDRKDFISQKFLQYVQSVPWQDVYIQTDREEYIAGEDMWFNAWLTDRKSFNLTDDSKIVYFELLNNEKRPVLQKRILMDKGTGPGHVIIPDTLSSGKYTLRAYTNWMKNFLPYNCFVKNITIYNVLDTKAADNFFKSTFRINDKPVQNDAVSGLKIRINNSKPDSLVISLTTDYKFRDENNDVIYIFIQTHGNINFVEQVKLTGETTEIHILKSLLDNGINQVTIFDSYANPVADRFIYSPGKGADLHIHFTDSIGLREKIAIRFDGDSLTDLSISVAPFDSRIIPVSMADYLVFGSEFFFFDLNGNCRENTGNLTVQEIDSILVTVRSNWIDWKKILASGIPDFKYPSEKTEHFINGRLLSNENNNFRSGEDILVCIPGKEASFQYARTDSNGNFRIRVGIDEELKDLVIMPEKNEKERKIIIESPFSDQYFQTVHKEDVQGERLPEYVRRSGINYQVQKIYGISAVGKMTDHLLVLLKLTRFYGKPDIELLLADYIHLPVMTEVFFELLPGVSLKKKKSEYEISITYRIEDYQFTTSPCLMIDGVIIKDASLIADLDPELIEKIDVIRGNYMVGKYLFPGLVNVISKSGNFTCIPLPEYMVRIPYEVINVPEKFIAPEYSSVQMKNSRLPDYRNTLYWNPSVKSDKDGIVFWSSDNKGDYLINIQGVTRDGNVISIKKLFKVR